METTPNGEIPSHRACAHCRSQKVRCLPDEQNPDVCQRCARSGRPCVFTPLQKRKQRKRTDTRVAELEREMRTMRAMLKNKQEGRRSPLAQAGQPEGRPGNGLWYQQPAPEATRTDQQVFAERPQESGVVGRVTGEQVPQASSDGLLYPDKLPDHPAQRQRDVVDRGLLSMATARQLFETYRKDLFPHYPTVAIPDGVSADDWRRTKPTLFLAIIAAAAGKENSELSAVLDKEILQAYATRSLVQSEKSLELVQALLISAVWYHPPNRFGQLKYYEYIHMAATMAMDIGIGTRPSQHRGRVGNATRGREPAKQALIHPAEDPRNPDLSMTPRSRDGSPDTGSLESRRTFLACYMICAGVSLSLRRPNMLRVSSYVRECVEYLERSADTIPTDRMLVAWARLVMIAEEICNAFCYDDPGGIASIAELRTQLMLKDFDQRLTAWYSSVPGTECNGSMSIMYYTVRLYLHEIALHIDHSPEDFRAPYQMGVIHPLDCANVPTQVLADSIAECISSSHALLNTFLAMDVESLRALPVFSYVRVSFAAFVLAKLCLSASNPSSRISKVLDRSSLKIESIMDRTILHVRNIVGQHRCRVPAIFLALLFKLRQWCLNPEMIERAESASAIEVARETMTNEAMSASRGGELTFDGPRVIEQNSSSDNTPETLAGGQQVAFESVTDPAAALAAYQATSPQPVGARYSSGSVMIPADDQVSGSTGFLPVGTDAMQLDQDMMQYFGDMSGFPEGGLTGLDDWMPNDLTGFGGLSDMSSWQSTPSTGESGAS